MDTSDNPEENKILELLVASSEEFLQSAGSELNYQKILETVADISGAKYSVFNLYEQEGSKFTTVAISAPKGIIKKASAFFLKEPRKRSSRTSVYTLLTFPK